MESDQATSPATPRLKINIDIEVNGQPAFKAHLEAEGDAQALRSVAEQLSASIAQAMTRVVGSPTPTDAPASLPSVALSAPSDQPPITTRRPPATSHQPPSARRSALPIWLTDNHRLTLIFGGVLVLAAILVAIVFPPLVPRAQRIEVFMMSLAFGLIGSVTLFAGALPQRSTQPKLTASSSGATTAFNSSQSQTVVHPISKSGDAKPKLVLDARRRALLQAQESRKPLGALWGFGFGVLFLVSGIVAPFVLGQASADERFLMMIGFAPVAITGALMIGLFWRTLSQVSTPDGKVVGPAGFRIGVPLAIGLLLVVLFVVLGLVLLGTLIPILSR